MLRALNQQLTVQEASFFIHFVCISDTPDIQESTYIENNVVHINPVASSLHFENNVKAAALNENKTTTLAKPTRIALQHSQKPFYSSLI